MKKILHISKYYHPFIGGVEQVARDIVNSLQGEYEQKILCFNHNKEKNESVVDDIEVIRVNCQFKISSQSIAMSYGKTLKKVLKEYNPDIVIFHYPNPFVAHYLMKYLKHKTFKFILYWHLDITKQKILGKFFNNQNKNLLKYADKVVATSPNYIEGSQWLSKFKDKCVVIPCCINEERLKLNDEIIKKSLEIKEFYKDKHICFAFGRHVEYKGLTYLIQASKYLNDDYIILIGGQGPLTDNLKKEAKNDNKIKFLGKLPNDELKAYLKVCDVFCFPSITKNEAFGIGLAEAMYYSKPAVTFTIPGSGVNYVNLNGITGLEVENRNVEAYANAIIEITTKDNNYGINARNRVVDNFLYETFKKNINKVVKELII